MMPSTSSLRRFVLRAFAVAAALTTLLQAPVWMVAQTQAARVTVPTLAPAAYANVVDVGPVPASETFTVTLTLTPTAARAAALDVFLAGLTTSSSSNYHKWMTPQQFASAYGATDDQLAQISLWAQTQGLAVASVSPAGTRVTLTGSAAQMEAAFGVAIDSYREFSFQYFANQTQPSLPAVMASLVTSIDGLANLPGDLRAFSSGPGVAPATLVNGKPSLQDVPTLAALIDANVTPILSLDATFGSTTLTAAQLGAYQILFRQAAAQGVTTLVGRVAVSGGFPSGLADVTAVASPGDIPDYAVPFSARPDWQVAPGLPGDGLRHTPDVTVSSLADLTAEITKLAGGGRLGNIAPVLYALAPTPALFAQPDAAAAGTWETATGLGLLDLVALDKVYPRGTGSSFTSFQATNYSPIHGQGTSFTSMVTSGTGGATPTGTVSFTASTGVVIGTAPLISGSASISINTLDGGNLTVSAVYSGDGTYAPSTSPSAQLYIQPEPSALSVTIGGTPTVGGNYTVTVTDTATSGVGQPAGPITVTISGTSNSYTAALQPATSNSASATVIIPATTAGTLTLAVTCTTSPNYSCYNPYTTTVTIMKATPTLSISYSPNPPVSGASIALNAVVSTVGAAPAPTGSVTFFDNGTTLNAGQLNGGTTSTTGTVPTTATHSITATYAGDGNYNSVSTTAGSSSNGTITTTLALAASSSTVTAGQSVTFTATLAAASAGPASPTGSVSFLDGGTQIGTANLVGTTATFATTSLSATVNHTITAVYSGDGYYGASTSNAVGVTGTTSSNTSAISLVLSSTNPVHGSNVTFTATVSSPSGGPVPTGSVTFTNAATGTVGQATLANGVATYTTNQLPGGTSTFTASYSGSNSYNPSFSSAASVTVTPEPVMLSIAVPPTATFGTSFTVIVTVSGGSGVPYPTGTVTLTPQGTGYSAASQGGVTSAGTTSVGSAAITVPATGAGAITFTATYSGDKSFAAAGPVTVTATILKATSTVSLSFSPTAPVAGQATTLIAKVAFASSIAPTGTVKFYNGTAFIGSGILDATGTATFPTTFPAGNQALTAVYSGDINYTGGTSPIANTNTGTTPTATTLAIVPNPVAPGALLTFSSTVGPTVNGVAPTGTVQFITSGIVSCTGTLVNGTATCGFVLSGTAAGTLNYTAVYSGDTTYAASTSPVVAVAVSAGTGSLISSIAPSTAAGGATVFVTAIVTAPAGIVPSGSVSATVTSTTNSGVVYSTASTVIVANGTSNTATVIVPVVVPGVAATYNVTVSCVNTNFTCLSNNLALTSAGGTNGNKIATTTVLTAAASGTITGGTTLTATVTPATAGAAVPTGTVVFYDGATQIGIGTIAAGVTAGTYVATANVTLTGAAAHSLTAVYSGDVAYAGSVSAAITGTPGTTAPTTPTITLTANTTSGLAGSTIVLTASVTGVTAGGAVPTGIVSFYSAGTTPRLLGTATLGKAGANLAQAVLSTTLLTSGSQSVYAVYAGDANFATVTSNFLTLGLSDYTLTFVPQSLTLNPGKSGVATITLGLLNGFAGSVSFGCTPPANTQITCSFAPTILTGGGSTTMTITTVAPKLDASQRAANDTRNASLLGAVSVAGLLCFFLPAGRRRRIPALLLALVALALTANLGCTGPGSFYGGPVSGTPLGTVVVMVNTAGSDGVNTVRHDYAYQVTVQ